MNTSAIRQKVENDLGYSSKIQTNHKVKYLVYITFLTSCLIAEVFKYAYCVLYFDQTHDPGPYYLLIPIIATLGPFSSSASRKCNVPYIISKFFVNQYFYHWCVKHQFLLCPVLMECLAHQKLSSTQVIQCKP